jgi:hypothetical protein
MSFCVERFAGTALRPGSKVTRWLIAIACWLAACVSAPAVRAQTPADAAQPPLSIALFVSSREDQCFDSGIVPAILNLAKAEQNRINAEGGVLRRQIQVQVFDDQRVKERTIANIKEAMAHPYTVAMLGLTNSTIAKAAFDTAGDEIGASKIPFLSDIGVTTVFEKYPNVYSMRPSQDEERIPAMIAFMKSRGIERPAFVGIKDALVSSSLGDGLLSGGAKLVADHRLSLKNNPAP